MKIVVLEAGSLHLGYIGCYGNEWVATPNLDRLAAESVVFDQHYAEEPFAPQEQAWLQAFSAYSFFKTAAGDTTLDTFTTFGRSLHALPEGSDWLLWLRGPDLAPPWNLPDEVLASYFDEVAGSVDSGPWPDPPLGWLLEDQRLERLQNTYAAVVTYFDAQLGRFVELLQGRHWGTDLVLVVTARSGLALGEHGLIGPCRAWLHQEVVHVPLIIRLPGKAEAGRRVLSLTQPADLAATLAEWLHTPASVPGGESLCVLLTGERDEVRENAYSWGAVGSSAELALRTRDWALLVPQAVPPEDAPRGPQLFRKPEDRWEVNDVRLHFLELAESLENKVREWRQER